MKEQYEIAFLSFKDKLSSFIFRLVTNRQDTEDIVHETYLKVFDSIHTFQKKSSFKTWVFTIALNKAKITWTNKKDGWKMPRIMVPIFTQNTRPTLTNSNLYSNPLLIGNMKSGNTSTIASIASIKHLC